MPAAWLRGVPPTESAGAGRGCRSAARGTAAPARAAGRTRARRPLAIVATTSSRCRSRFGPGWNHSQQHGNEHEALERVQARDHADRVIHQQAERDVGEEGLDRGVEIVHVLCDPGGRSAHDMRPAGSKSALVPGATGKYVTRYFEENAKNTGNPLIKRGCAVGPDGRAPRGGAHRIVRRFRIDAHGHRKNNRLNWTFVRAGADRARDGGFSCRMRTNRLTAQRQACADRK